MVKLLIVDDEPLVCVGLSSMLEWEKLGIEVLGSARNGQEAAEMIAQFTPDIVIADIRMPVMSGLDLVEVCSKRYGRIPLFILLTSFDDFDYVRRALQTGVVDYLIKLDLTPEILRSSIEKALKILAEHRRIESIEEESGVGGARFYRERFFLMLYNNLFENDQQYFEFKEEASVDFPAGSYVTAVCEFDETTSVGISNDKMMKLFENAMQIAYKTISDTFNCYITPFNPRSFSIALCLGNDESIETEALLKKTLTNMKDMLRGYLNVCVRVAVGHVVSDPRHLSESYIDAKRLCSGLADFQVIQFSDRRQSSKQHLIANVQKYIRENLRERIPLNEVAIEFGLSTGYLSQIFTKTIGKSYVEFVTEARIAEAKDMLASGEYKIYEVAEILSFGNAFYFSKVFKKIEGVSPREYLKKILGMDTC